MHQPRYVAVVGAGMAGAACARGLTDRGHVVRVLDKGRTIGGRMAQRRVGDAVFDHGAQYLTVRDPAFAAAAEGWRAAGALAPWPGVTGGDGTPAEVGVPGWRHPPSSSSPALGSPSPGGSRRSAANATAAGRCATRPAARPARSTPSPSPSPPRKPGTSSPPTPPRPGCATRSRASSSSPAGPPSSPLAGPFRPEIAGERVADDTLGWVARNTSKPGRGGAEAWTLHATPAWSRRHLDRAPAEIAPLLGAALARTSGAALPDAVHLSAHRWRYALARHPLGEPCLYDPDLGLGLCGDWCLGPRVESAFLSGAALAERMAGRAS
jgi:predicted NAD/FAD-dependent oxidoreductase